MDRTLVHLVAVHAAVCERNRLPAEQGVQQELQDRVDCLLLRRHRVQDARAAQRVATQVEGELPQRGSSLPRQRKTRQVRDTTKPCDRGRDIGSVEASIQLLIFACHSSSERQSSGFEAMTLPLHSGKPQASSASFAWRANGKRRSRTCAGGATS